jgi:arsenate reductase
MILYGLKTCDTCRKARKALTQAEFRDVREDGVPTETLQKAFEQFAGKLLNTRSTTWRNLSDEDRDGEVLELLAAHPTLMKRPLILDGDQMYLGWDKATQAVFDA